MDLREEVQKLLDKVPNLPAAAVKKAKFKASERRVRRARKRKSVWVREWLLKRHKYGMYEASQLSPVRY